MVFTIFMILIGIQRYSIEQWRSLSDREPYHILGAVLKQSELISIIMVLLGLIATSLLYFHYRKDAAGTGIENSG